MATIRSATSAKLSFVVPAKTKEVQPERRFITTKSTLDRRRHPSIIMILAMLPCAVHAASQPSPTSSKTIQIEVSVASRFQLANVGTVPALMPDAQYYCVLGNTSSTPLPIHIAWAGKSASVSSARTKGDRSEELRWCKDSLAKSGTTPSRGYSGLGQRWILVTPE